jgi:GT2 family glycosyltransferase
MGLTIGYIHGELVHARFMTSVLDAVDRRGYAYIEEESGPNLSGARNRLVSRFLESEAEWLFMVDTDIVFRDDVIERLLLNGASIVSAMVYVDGDKPFPMAYRRLADVSVGMPLFMAMDEWQEGSCVEVDAVGAGCLLVHRDVYSDIARRIPNRAALWFQETVIGERLIGEDISFCMKASQLGYKIFIDTSVNVGHIKPKIIGSVI